MTTKTRLRHAGGTRLAYSLAGIGAALASAAVLAQAAGGTPDAAALANGRDVYAASCAMCHGATLGGGPGGPAIVGPDFKAKWASQPHAAFVQYLREAMPPGGGGSLPDKSYEDVAAFIMAANHDETGATAQAAQEAPTHRASAAGGGSAELMQAPAAQERETRRLAVLDALRPVTDEMLRNPPEGDWLHWRRTYDGQGFSGLGQVNRETVKHLQPAWTWQLDPGNNEITPLVHDGVIYVMSGNRLDALDGSSGDLLWQYTRPGSNGILRNLAIYGENIYLAANTNVVALDMRTGKPVWDKQIAPTGTNSKVSGGPLAVKGKILQGMSLCTSATAAGCFVVALDAKTGEEAWRFHTIAKPGEPGGDSWNDLPLAERAGASVWITGSYDPELDLYYVGTGQTYQTGNLMRGTERAAALYTDTTLALRPDSGKLAWHFQHQDGDVWDMDWSFERVLADIRIGNKLRRTITTGGKIGLFDTIDAATGKYLFSTDLGSQTLVKGVDPKTGKKMIDPSLVPVPGKMVDFCPGTLGGRNWPATALNPATNILYVPFNDNCARIGYDLAQGNGGGGVLPDKRDPEGRIGRVQAIDLNTRETLWTRRERSPEASGILATAGGLIFEGNRDRWFRASDDRTGAILWQTRLNASPSSYPISYSVGGVQYVAVVAGGGNFNDILVGRLAPEIVTTTGQSTLWIFRLPAERGAP